MLKLKDAALLKSDAYVNGAWSKGAKTFAVTNPSTGAKLADVADLTGADARAAIDAAQLLQFAYPGVPMVYYGDEVGQPGGADPDNRHPLPPQSAWVPERLGHTRRLCRLRREHPALREGRYVSLAQLSSW